MDLALWAVLALAYLSTWGGAVAIKTRSDVKWAKKNVKAGTSRKDIRADLGGNFTTSFWLFSVWPLMAVLAVFFIPGMRVAEYLDRQAGEVYTAVNPPADLRESDHAKEIRGQDYPG